MRHDAVIIGAADPRSILGKARDQLAGYPGVRLIDGEAISARAPNSLSWAVADGVTAGTSAHRALVFG